MKLTDHFNLIEFTCPCGCGETSIDARLLAVLEDIRTKLGRPVRINSGYRCPPHNAAVGGETDSRHLIGQAADVSGVDLELFRQTALQDPRVNGIAIDRQRGFVHLDVRRGPRTEWAYKDGKAVPALN